MTISIQVEAIAPLIESELWPLLEAHRDELTTNKELMNLAPDIGRYAAMEDAGFMFGLTARENGHVVGYSVNLISQHLHYSALRYVHNDVLFLDKGHRFGTLGLRMLRATRAEAKARGARLVVWHAKPGTPLESILRRQGARVQDVLFSEVL